MVTNDLIFSIRRMTECGILAYHSKTWLGTKPPCEKSEVEVIPVDLIHFSWALYLVALGIPFSGAILLGEIMLHRYRVLNEKKDVKEVVKDWFGFAKLRD